MIHFILMLLGLAFPNNNTQTTNDNNSTPITTQNAANQDGEGLDPGDTGGDTGPVRPPKI
ncbi:hypothetical protein [Chryseobacterium sp. Marseille-Q3244]|uniref:hypothetical protein n=1 Tax=Chryseobacterium sp. Marseille-Q3244 TaxID=2758092 RepID=UPI0020244154|nr:hypothetical protein [Chryseobacterium sp. Marseille-Q3244]